ncbi:uncharacterized protein LOC116254590 isoform X1 [Nymphaea colorata]|nr:uncharacterized protein LOC116254590 isoform X1 [Nymphaea colorata]
MSSNARTKQTRDHALEFQGLLNDLQNWERSMNEKDKKLKAESRDTKRKDSAAKNVGMLKEEKSSETQMASLKSVPNVQQKNKSNSQFSYMKNSDEIATMSFSAEESTPNANSEKEQGNVYFKQKKFTEAIDCYSRSVALSPTAVAYANRAMAYIKIGKFQEAENDCTEALNLDDRYVKAYSRRATARKELGKYQASIEDSEFALRLEPENQELRKQYAEARALYDKGNAKKSATAVQRSIDAPKTGRSADSAPEVKQVLNSHLIQETHQRVAPKSQADHIKGESDIDGKQKSKLNVQELASRAASRAMESAAKTITTPKSAYQFEVLWRGVSDNRVLQTSLLKTIEPVMLPQLFKNALSAPILMDIVKCIATFFMEDTGLAVSMLDNLSKVTRFDMIIMCLLDADRAELWKIWDEVLLNQPLDMAYVETLQRLHPKYCPQRRDTIQ